MSNINIHYDSDLSINLDITQCITNIFKILNLNPCTQINILFVDNNKIAELNSEFRGILEPTDILSFSERIGLWAEKFETTCQLSDLNISFG